MLCQLPGQPRYTSNSLIDVVLHASIRKQNSLALPHGLRSPEFYQTSRGRGAPSMIVEEASSNIHKDLSATNIVTEVLSEVAPQVNVPKIRVWRQEGVK